MIQPRLKKRLGQHHLVDGSWCAPIISFLQPSGRRVLEIGPGGGVLTAELLRAGASVLACELDPEWAFAVRRQLASSKLSLMVADVLTIAWEKVPEGTLVTGNLPYGVAGEIILRLLQQSSLKQSAFLIQKEVADRLVARPGEKAYGALTLQTAVFADVVPLGSVPRSFFRPQPKVDGAYVGITRRQPPIAPEEIDGLCRVIRIAFAHRRKTLRNSCSAAWGRSSTERVLDRAGIDSRLRAEVLPLEDFVKMYRAFRDLGDN
jgi:16S rRNA (adenine1518-N6/adenine1519-N6)-dimethyltransferase